MKILVEELKQEPATKLRDMLSHFVPFTITSPIFPFKMAQVGLEEQGVLQAAIPREE